MANMLLQKLDAWGCDMRGAMERMMGNEGLFMKLLPAVVSDDAFGRLGEALEAGEYRTAFEHAHQIKGFVGNMGLLPLYTVDCEIVEKLRREIMPKSQTLSMLLQADPLRTRAPAGEVAKAVAAGDPDLLFTSDDVHSMPEYAQVCAMVGELHGLLLGARARYDELMRLRGQLSELLTAFGA